MRKLLIFQTLFLAFALNANAAPNKVRGGGTPPEEVIIEKFEKLFDSGKQQEAEKYLIKFATQTRRQSNSRLKLLKKLSGKYAELKDESNYFRTIDLAKSIDESLGHFLNVTHFYDHEHYESVGDSLNWLVVKQSDYVERLRINFIWDLYRRLKKANETKAIDLVKNLYEYNYPREWDAYTIDRQYQELVEHYLAKNDLSAARKVLDNKITDIYVLMDFWHDKKYRQLWPYLPGEKSFDPLSPIDKRIDDGNKFLDQTDDLNWNQWVRGKAEITMLYNMKGEYVKAVQVAQKTFEEMDGQNINMRNLIWLTREKAFAHHALGQRDSFEEIFSGIFENDSIEYSTIVNAKTAYMMQLLESGRLADTEVIASEIEKNINPLSEFGKIKIGTARICVYAQTGRTSQAKVIYKTIKKFAESNYQDITMAALCLKDKSEAIAFYLARLNDESERADTLRILSSFSFSDNFGYYSELNRLKAEVIESPRIQQAIKQYGRTGDWELPASYWNEY